MSKRTASDGLTPQQIIAALCHAHGLTVPQFEYRFDPKRRWRFDAAFPAMKVAIEVEGGVFSGGRHTRGAGFVKDLEKYNAATVAGWKVLRYTPTQIRSGAWVAAVTSALMELR